MHVTGRVDFFFPNAPSNEVFFASQYTMGLVTWLVLVAVAFVVGAVGGGLIAAAVPEIGIALGFARAAAQNAGLDINGTGTGTRTGTGTDTGTRTA
jgi:hypothetical protein